MIIAFLDIDNQSLNLYTEEGVKFIALSNQSTIRQEIGDKKVLYITNAIEANAQDILDLLSSLGIQSKQAVVTTTDKVVEPSTQRAVEPMVLMSASNKRIVIPELDDLVLPGQIAFVELKKLQMKFDDDVIEKSFYLKQWLKEKKILLIPISEGYARVAQNIAKLQTTKDKDLDSIIVNKNVATHLKEIEEGEDAPVGIEIDLDNERNVRGSSNEDTLINEDNLPLE